MCGQDFEEPQGERRTTPRKGREIRCGGARRETCAKPPFAPIRGNIGLELAAESLGASFGQRFFHIILPSLQHSIFSGLVVVSAISIGEFQITNLIAGFLNRTYPVVLLQSFYGATGFACSTTMVLLLLACASAAGSALTARSASKSKKH